MSGLSEGEWKFMQNNMSRIVSFIVLLASIVVIGALFYKVMIGFLVPIFLAAVLVVVFRPLHRWVMAQVGEREHLAAAITTCIPVPGPLASRGNCHNGSRPGCIARQELRRKQYRCDAETGTDLFEAGASLQGPNPIDSE